MPSRLSSRRSSAQLGYGLLAVTDTLLAGRSSASAQRLRYLTKPLLMPALGTASTSDTDGRRDALRNGTLVALAFSWAGDVALLGSSRRTFLTGVASFAAAHVAYIGGFLTARDRKPRRLNSDKNARPDSGSKAAAVTWLVLMPVVAIAAGRKDPALRVPVAGYATLLCTMFATSTRLDPELPSASRRRIVLGTSLFLVSDAVLGIEKFLLKDAGPRLGSVVMATYTAGQWLIVDGVARASD